MKRTNDEYELDFEMRSNKIIKKAKIENKLNILIKDLLKLKL